MNEVSGHREEDRRADRGSQILVVEDVSVTREFLRALLEDGGYCVRVTTTAAEAQQALAEAQPDLLVLDLLLPDGNGLEVCQALRSLPDGDDIPVLVITVDERPQSHAEAVRAGVDDFLRKPLLPTELQTRVRSLLRLRQLRQELRRDRDAIISLQSRKDELLQFVVHDLKNIANSLLASVELMEMDADPEHCERQRKRIGETTRSLVKMVQSMLDISVHDQAGLVPQPEQIELETWLRQVGQELEPLSHRRNQVMEIDVEAGLCLEADPQLLERVMFNLVENANKYGPSGGRVCVSATRDGESVRLSVSDEGEGIPGTMKLRIFDRFVRVEGLPGARTGRGLGLAFCHLVAELHGGRIWVEDHVPRGSRFVIELPCRFWHLGD